MRPRLLDLLADLLDALALRIWRLAHRLRPVYEGPRCPDCGTYAVDTGDGCPECAERADMNRRIRDAYDAGYEDATGRYRR